MCIAFIILLLENSKLFYILLLFCLHIEILAVSSLFKCLIANKFGKWSGDTPDFNNCDYPVHFSRHCKRTVHFIHTILNETNVSVNPCTLYMMKLSVVKIQVREFCPKVRKVFDFIINHATINDVYNVKKCVVTLNFANKFHHNPLLKY